MPGNAGKTVEEILKGKKAGIKQAQLEECSPSWDDIMGLTWEEIEEKARNREPGFQTIHKLLKRRKFNK